jgi:polar amino acid transport system permease protein
LRRIILPQALVAMIPPWGNLFIDLLKTTALVSTITMSDLTFKARTLNDATLKTIQIFSLAFLMYLIVSLAITIGMRFLDRAAVRGMARGRG